AAALARLEAVLDRRVANATAEAVAARRGATLGPGPHTLAALLRTPGIGVEDVEPLAPGGRDARAGVREKVVVRVKCAGSVRRQEREVAAAPALESRSIPADLDFTALAGLSTEAAQKLARLRPRNAAQASRIDGVRAADLSLLLVHLRRRER